MTNPYHFPGTVFTQADSEGPASGVLEKDISRRGSELLFEAAHAARQVSPHIDNEDFPFPAQLQIAAELMHPLAIQAVEHAEKLPDDGLKQRFLQSYQRRVNGSEYFSPSFYSFTYEAARKFDEFDASKKLAESTWQSFGVKKRIDRLQYLYDDHSAFFQHVGLVKPEPKKKNRRKVKVAEAEKDSSFLAYYEPVTQNIGVLRKPNHAGTVGGMRLRDDVISSMSKYIAGVNLFAGTEKLIANFGSPELVENIVGSLNTLDSLLPGEGSVRTIQSFQENAASATQLFTLGAVMVATAALQGYTYIKNKAVKTVYGIAPDNTQTLMASWRDNRNIMLHEMDHDLVYRVAQAYEDAPDKGVVEKRYGFTAADMCLFKKFNADKALEKANDPLDPHYRHNVLERHARFAQSLDNNWHAQTRYQAMTGSPKGMV